MRNGNVTPLLFRELSKHGEGVWNAQLDDGLQITYAGSGGEFSCLDDQMNLIRAENSDGKKKKMLWIAAGAGVTPFMAMWAAVYQRSDLNVHLMLSSRSDDLAVQQIFLNNPFRVLSRFDLFLTSTPSISEASCSTIGSQGCEMLVKNSSGRRIQRGDFESIENLVRDYVVYLCGPNEFMKQVSHVLQEIGVTDIHSESFSF